MNKTIIAVSLISALIGGGVTATVGSTEADVAIEKVSATEIKIKTTAVNESTISLAELKLQKERLNNFKQQDVNSCNARIAEYEKQEIQLDSYISEAVKKGVVEKVEGSKIVE